MSRIARNDRLVNHLLLMTAEAVSVTASCSLCGSTHHDSYKHDAQQPEITQNRSVCSHLWRNTTRPSMIANSTVEQWWSTVQLLSNCVLFPTDTATGQGKPANDASRPNTDTHLMASFRDNLVKPAPEKVKPPIWILMKQEMTGWQWHQLDHICIYTSFQTDNHISTPSLICTGRMLFLTPNQQCESTEGNIQSIP